jgi:hypothetical protein
MRSKKEPPLAGSASGFGLGAKEKYVDDAS